MDVFAAEEGEIDVGGSALLQAFAAEHQDLADVVAAGEEANVADGVGLDIDQML